MKLIIHTDGGARGNPGPAGAGAAIYDEEKKLLGSFNVFLGNQTNNQAEYKAVILALNKAAEMGGSRLAFYLDSELVVRQLTGQYKIKNQGIAPLAEEALRAMKRFENVTFTHIPREQNKLADKLVNEAIDRGK